MLKIRLARGGAKKRPYYSIVVADSHSPRDGRFIEKVGTYNPLLKKDDPIRTTLKLERIQEWIGKGAQPTDRVARFLAQAGVMTWVHGQNLKKGEPGKKAKERVEERAKREADSLAAAAEAAARPAPEPEPDWRLKPPLPNPWWKPQLRRPSKPQSMPPSKPRPRQRRPRLKNPPLSRWPKPSPNRKLRTVSRLPCPAHPGESRGPGHRAQTREPRMGPAHIASSVIWIPACAGMTGWGDFVGATAGLAADA